ncbi:DUF7344 domain-containing protein [Candidatus Halobonum tyrrellensis]|uniref:DUF7344 domain-containing protein n=1 Tax=Candidatus Halobonum tyrrellensis G22 TaxID=1324957 RepID=V4HFG7_9EURY|nr:hypothetical protein [Candidatus Halobonum tyrrellensis]ESP88813.1 hypothetical protein K933_06947 [Candidatus Halobonum tyrrellensis G22]
MDDGDGTDGDASGPVLPVLPEAVLRLDTVYDALANPTRRAVCYLLSERDRWPLSDLAARVAAIEEGVAPSAVDATARDRASAALYHVHLPRLADRGVVTFDAEADAVSAGPAADRVLAALDAMARLVEDGAGAGDGASDDPVDGAADAGDRNDEGRQDRADGRNDEADGTSDEE